MRQRAKSVVQFMAMAIMLPMEVLYLLNASISGADRTLQAWSQALALLPGLWGAYLRTAFYRRVLSGCSRDVRIGFGTLFSHPGASLGRGVYVGAYCLIGDVELGDDVLLASFVSITNGGHQHGIDRLDAPIRRQPGVWTRISIGADTWIGERTVVMADVGAHCVIGAGSVVTRPIPDFAVAVGVPARVIRDRRAMRGDLAG